MTVRRLLALPLLGLLLGGCGIRATEVPTDFGAAPSRVPCSLPGPKLSTQSAQGVPVQVFLLCGASLVAVDRSVRVPEGTPDARRRVIVAQGLLDQLAASPAAAERSAGYTTYVPGALNVTGPHPGDPEDALRLSTPPSRLTSYALAQLVCTLSDSAATEGDGSVILGGPDAGPLHRYECTADVRDRPGTIAPPSSEVTGR
ncbi:hypothetical protein AQI95_08675 [Streptomyces yokosukanensis]|uniref:Lipoprotein n=1 Tax=Streptomyces yokosukanensis TaxID=67386 RepID=A0A101PBK9_9ACTN|nr:hypothetical protein [Streptomyces yokosukanensis]KUN08434.1 hypothetical protein AQI95_08675 [Streptomyces yokosukanensis]